ncbi:putative deleted in malignant brain tumors 1 protein, partial [Apostichopus japonicus]
SLQGCADPQVRDFVKFDDVSRNDTSRTIHLHCEEHHSSLGEHHSTCTYDVITGKTKWLPNPSEFICFAFCTPPADINELVTVHNQTQYDVQLVQLQCPHYYTSSGGSMLTCIYNGTTQQTHWEPDPLDFNCHTPCVLPDLQDGVKSSPEEKFIWDGEDVTFSCTNGLLLGPEKSRCRDGDFKPALTQRCDFDQGRVRLHHGRVMVRYNGLEGSVCFTEEWNIHNANVVCRQLGYRPYAVSVKRIPFLDAGNDLIHFDSVLCEGYEKQLIDCGISFSSCHTQSYAGVVCLEADETANEWSVRLINQKVSDSEPSSGRIEIYNNGQWGAVCINGWTRQSGHVVCRQLGYAGAVNISKDMTNNEKAIYHRFECTGDEKSIKDCPRTVAKGNCLSGAIGTVVCESPEKFALRLMNGTSPKVGRLEIFDGVHWRAVSDTFEHGYITPKLICDKLVEEGSYRNYDTDSEFGNGLVVPKYSYACPKDADSLDECLVVDASGHVTDDRPISLYCDKFDESTSMNPQLIFLLTFAGAVVIVVIAFLIRIKYHNKRVLHRKRSIISERYDHLPTESKELKKPITYKELQRTDTEGSDTVFD